MVGLRPRVGHAAGDAEGLSGIYLVVASGIQADNVCLGDPVHAGYGVEALPLLNGVQEVGLVFLCHDL